MLDLHDIHHRWQDQPLLDGVSLPSNCRGANNLAEFEPLWDCIEDVDLPVTFHVSTGRDPRAVGGNGGP